MAPWASVLLRGRLVGFLSLFNMRDVFWSSVSDFPGRKPTLFVFFAAGVALYIAFILVNYSRQHQLKAGASRVDADQFVLQGICAASMKRMASPSLCRTCGLAIERDGSLKRHRYIRFAAHTYLKFVQSSNFDRRNDNA
jgi:hypothetical protein